MIAAFIYAIVIVTCAAAVFAAAVIIAAWLDRPKPALRWADDRLSGWLSPPPGDHHKFAAPDAERITDTPAPGAEPGQALDPAPCKALEAAPTFPGARAAVLPAPPQRPVQGAGQHPFRPVIMQFPGGEVGILGADGRWHIRPLAWQPGIRETGAQPALVRGSYSAYEAWRDEAANQ